MQESRHQLNKTVLVSGAAGFIGFHTARTLLDRGYQVVGLDNLNSYYDVNLKQHRLDQLLGRNGFQFIRCDIADRAETMSLFQNFKFDRVIHLAAQAGVRHSILDPHAYVETNVVGFLNVLEGCRAQQTAHLVYASTSAVYGANKALPFSTHQNVDHPLSLYGATKKSNELMAHSYSHLFDLPTTGLRFFTVYGPWGRPDMALFSFTRKILNDEPIELFNSGFHSRDFTYIDDIVEGIVRTVEIIPSQNPHWDNVALDPSTSSAPYRIFNIGNSKPVSLLYFLSCLEDALGKKAKKILVPLQPGDVKDTYADVTELADTIKFAPTTSIEQGITKFINWYREYYKIPAATLR